MENPAPAVPSPSTNPAADVNTRRRDGNNFDFLRFILASLVIVSHSPMLLDGDARREPLARITADGLTLGALAVNGFFLISGFLILQSWLFSRGVGDFFKKRVLRIYPAFVVATIFSVLLAGALGAANAHEYWRQMDAGYFLQQAKRIASLRIPNTPPLIPNTPPVFAGLPYPAVNGAIWTVRYEFACYLGIAALGLAGLAKRRVFVLACAVAAYAVFAAQHLKLITLSIDDLPVLGTPAHWPRFATYFLAGMCFYHFREKFRPSALGALIAAGALLLGCAVPRMSVFVLPVFGAWLLFAAAFSPAIRLHHFGKHGDFSYGIFLYGWPVQTLLIWHFGRGLHPAALSALALAGAAGLAWCSWHLVERPCLAFAKKKPPVSVGA